MKKKSARVIFFGNERLATGITTEAKTLRALISAGYNVVAVVSNFEPTKSRNARALEVEQITTQHNIPLLLPKKLSDITEKLRNYRADIGVLVAYGKIVPESIIDIFPRGIINIHPSLLPLHRGPTPIESVILRGDPQTGVSLMRLAKAMDAGPVYAQENVEVPSNVSKQTLADILLERGANMLLECLPAILDGSLEPYMQDESQATYDTKIEKEASTLDWNKPAELLEREVRAYQEWPKSKAVLGTVEVVVIKAHVEKGVGSPGEILQIGKKLGVYTKQGMLAIDRLKPLGKQEMPAEAFLAGYGKSL